MSTTDPANPELVEDTKQQIRALVNEIADLAASEIPESEFYEGFLSRVVTALAAHGGVIWKIGDTGRLEIAYQINLRESGLVESEEKQMTHGKLLRRLMKGDEPIIAQPQSGSGDEEEGGNPTDFLLVLDLLKADQEIVGIVEVFQRPGTAPATQRGYLRFLMQMTDLAGDYFKTRSLRQFTDRQTLWNQLEQFTQAIHRNLDQSQTAFAIANEGRRLIECDRVSVATCRGTRCKIRAVSGQDTFDKRSNTIQLLQQLSNAVVRQGEPVWYTGDTSDMPPQVEDAVQDYVDESHTKMLVVLPLRRSKEVDEATGEVEQEAVVGAIVIEQIEDARPKAGMRQRVEVVVGHSSSAMANATEHQNLFLMPLWRKLGQAKAVMFVRNLPKTITIAGAVAAVILALCIVPGDYELKGEGTLQPTVQHEVFTKVDGTISQVMVKTGQRVEKGQILVQMENKDLEMQLKDTEKKIGETEAQILAATEIINSSDSNDPEQAKAAKDAAMDRQQLRETLVFLRGDKALVGLKIEMLAVRSPIEGEVVTWDVKHRLEQRPVHSGDLLLNVAATAEKDEWRLKIDMPEDRMGDILRAIDEWERDPTKTEEEKKNGLPIRYILATNPEDDHPGTIARDNIGKIATVQGEEGSAVRIFVTIRKSDIDPLDLRQGATVKGMVMCGRRPIGYVWFHDVIKFVHSKLLFPYF